MPDRRLQPPPRVPAAGSDGPSVDPRTRVGRPSAARRIGLPILFTSLILGLIAVFVVLPRWQEAHQRARAAGSPTQNIATPRKPTIPRIQDAAGLAMTEDPRATPTPVNQPTQMRQAAPPTIGPSKTEREYRGAMSEGLEALENGRWEEARSALERAARLKPGAPEVGDALARVAAGERRDAITAGIQEAMRLEADEAWAKAEEVYATVLAEDPEAAIALDGHERAAHRADLDERLEYHIRNPGRLISPAVLEEASALLEEARGTNPRGPRLAEQMNRLGRLIEVASTPVPVVLESDNLTEIMILRVGRLGTFTRRELDLRPGIYTAVGSRQGFRDIRVRFEVVPGVPSKPVVIRCAEGI